MAKQHYQTRMREKLEEALQPTELTIIDQSADHAGHVGEHPDGETHFHITIASEQFRGLSRVAQQRVVYKVIAEELTEHVHALALSTKVPLE